MTNSQNPQNTPSRWQRRLLIMSPAMLLLVAILLFNWIAFRNPLPTTNGTETAPTAGMAIDSQEANASTIGDAPTSTAVALAIVMDPTPTTPPTVPAGTRVTLLGPPANSLMPADSSVVLYWTWPLPLAETQQFVVYLSYAGQETAVGIVAEPNLGRGYRLTLEPENLPAIDTVNWYVQLQHVETGAVLQTSSSRSFNLPAASN